MMGAKSEEANPFSGIAIARIGERSCWGVGDITQDMEKTCGSPVSPSFDLFFYPSGGTPSGVNSQDHPEKAFKMHPFRLVVPATFLSVSLVLSSKTEFTLTVKSSMAAALLIHGRL